ncbi:MAG: TadE/TadG family protein [Candidatus Obscuribacterales bacterium]|nr:TadE/TadG family protein [Candidatus Obscuribacterales bacterium]
MIKEQLRGQRGASIMIMVMILAFCILPLFGLLSFEVGRANLAQQQLQNAVDAASLAAVATLASQDDAAPAAAHANCKNAALLVFQANSILGMPLAPATIQATGNTSPAAGASHLFFEFLDPVSKAVVPTGDPRGKIVRVHGAIGAVPAFGKYLGIGNFVVRTTSHGAVPELDVVLCLDNSGSIDDQTNVTLVRRQWDPVLNKIVYKSPGSMSNGKIFDIATPGLNGTSFNGIPPQYLSMASRFWFSEHLTQFFGVPGLRSGGVYPEAGRPPGNFAAGAPTYDGGYNGKGVYTDMVVNIDGNTTFGGKTVTDGGFTYNFPTVESMVEASRGNLENAANYTNSKADTSLPAITPHTGYQAAYFKAAKAACQPIQDCRDASQLFCNIINTDTHAHFSIVSFDGIVGSNETSTESRRDIDENGNNSYGANTAFHQPLSPLDPDQPDTRYNEAITAIPLPVAKGATNIGAAIDAAVTQLTTNHRPNAVKAIVLFTDGQPTAGSPSPLAAARAAAVRARDAGIPVYTIGLALNPALIAPQQAILNDTNSNATSGGIAGISGQGATFNSVTNTAELREAFREVARALCQLVQAQ